MRRDVMTRAGLSLLALGMVATTGIAGSGCRGNKSADPPVHLNQNMDDMQFYQAQADNAWFPDDRAMRPPVEGTVARGLLKEDDAYHLGRDANGRLLEGLPEQIELDAALLDRGKARYHIYCAPCHADSGDGDGIVARRGLKTVPTSYFDPRMQAMPLGHFYDVITNGKGTMLPYAAQIPVADRWAIAAWVRVLQVSRRATEADVPMSFRENLRRNQP